MRLLILSLLTLSSLSAFAEPPRDLEKHPLRPIEWKAYRMSQSIAKELGEKTHPSCVNASFEPGENPVTVQFFYPDSEHGNQCFDPHFSIMVTFDKDGNLAEIDFVDA